MQDAGAAAARFAHPQDNVLSVPSRAGGAATGYGTCGAASSADAPTPVPGTRAHSSKLRSRVARDSSVWDAKLGSDGSPRHGKRVNGQSRGHRLAPDPSEESPVTIPLERAMNAKAHHKCLNRRSVSALHGVTQRIVSWGRSRDGSEFARGNRSLDTEGFCKSQMTLNSGLRWLRATLRCLRWNGRNSVPGCPRGHPEATLKPSGSQPVGTQKPP